MEMNKALRNYFYERSNQLTEEWHETIVDNDPDSVYSATNPEIVKNLKAQNNEFNMNICNIFIEEEKEFFQKFDSWIMSVAKDSEHVSTPIHYIIREFMCVREQYLNQLIEFIDQYPEEISRKRIDSWNRLLNRVFDVTITKYVEEYDRNSKERLRAQQEIIYELSSPVITLKNNAAILPLVGDIDTQRAKILLEKTLQQCSKNKITHLFIDLSGVVMIDTMVANEIFQLVEALQLIGVRATLSGIRPEIAVTAMQLGLSFNRISITSTLAQAIMLSEKEGINE